MARSSRLFPLSALARAYQRNLKAMTRAAQAASAAGARSAKAALVGKVMVGKSLLGLTRGRAVSERTKDLVALRRAATAQGDWLGGVAPGPAGARRYHLFVPHGLALCEGEKLPLLVMLHGCGQTGLELAVVTRMNRLAACERFLVLYPEQERLANVHGCWNWFERRSGKAEAEAATLLAAVDKVVRRHPVDLDRVAVAGLSAGASMAVLMAALYPERFCAVAMHSGVAPGTAESSATAIAAMHGQREAHVPDRAGEGAGNGHPGGLVHPGQEKEVLGAEPAMGASAHHIVALAAGEAPPPAGSNTAESTADSASAATQAYAQAVAAAAAAASLPFVPPRPDLPPLLLIHGDADAVVSVRNAQVTARLWAQALGAREGPARQVQRGQRRPAQVTEFKRRGKVVVALREVQGLEHAWSGGAAQRPYSDSMGPDASAWIWAFVRRQFKA